ncbi:MAG TPA: penicillin-binding protein 1C [Herbaspirillum sp.]
MLKRLVLALLLSGSAAMTAAPVAMAAVPAFAEVQKQFISSEASLYDRHGELLQQLRRNPNERRLSWIRLEDVSPALRNALIASEDKRFYQHSGVDWSAVAASAWGNLWNSKTRGASTITMQLAGLIYDDLRRKGGSRSLMQKISQAFIAESLERNWRKDQILEAYLNLVSFRGELVGVHALSRVLFDKHPSGLNQREAAIAVALIRAPNAAPARVAERACTVLKDQGAPDECKGLSGLTELLLARTAAHAETVGSAAAPQLAPHLARRLLTAPGQQVRSTLDADTQRFVQDAVRRQLSSLVSRNIEDAAVVVLDNASGDVLAWSGSSGAFSAAREVDGVLALRQAGSTLKPFLYQMAIEDKWLTAASVLEDSAINLATSGGLYIPQDYDKHFKGLVSLRTALGSSLNIPAVRTLVMVTPDRFFRRLQKLGFNLRESGDYYGYSLALGSADVSLLALTNAYRSLANGGRYGPVRTALTDPKSVPVQVMDAGAAYVISDILSDRSARARTFGLENALSTRIWTAVKTGTSKDMRDNWCVGYSSRYTVGVWVGNASGAPMWDVSGVTGAAPIWQEVIQHLHARDGSRSAPSAQPQDVLRQNISYQPPIEAPRTELFLRGTAQSLITLTKPGDATPSIIYPTAGMLVAIDPDIPPARQSIRFAAQGLAKGRWWLDGHALSPTVITTARTPDLGLQWMPWPGQHLLELRDVGGKTVDRLRFEVRGAVVKTAFELEGKDSRLFNRNRDRQSSIK